MPETFLVARPLWPVLKSLATTMASRGWDVQTSGSWEALLDVRAAGSGLAAAFLGEFGDIAGEEGILRRFRRSEGAGGVPVFLVGGSNALRWERRLRAAGVDQLFSAELPVPEILERSKPFRALGGLYRTVLEANRELLDLSLTDGLTGLPNRRNFTQSLDRCVEMARRTGGPLSCVVADIDGVRDVNEAHGYSAGDNVIRQFGDILDGSKRRYDIVARLGGDEFVWLLPGADADQAVRAARRVRRKVGEKAFGPTSGSFRVTATWGVASFSPASDRTGRSLMEDADRALYWGKETGKNMVRCYPPWKVAADG
ncbi:MAG: GGDEF domain-containing protein [Thermodesulfobacteriota bacterium]